MRVMLTVEGVDFRAGVRGWGIPGVLGAMPLSSLITGAPRSQEIAPPPLGPPKALDLFLL